MRLVAFMLLLVAGILQMSIVRGSVVTAEEALSGVLPELSEMDFYPHPDAPDILTVTEFDDHRLRDDAPQVFHGLQSIHVLEVRKSQPVGRDYYPDAVVEIWVYGSSSQTDRAVELLDSLLGNSWAFKAPASCWSRGDWMVYTRTRAEMFRPYLEDITETLQGSL
jgi:hypothetical protein